jgi:hypothetical protein
MTEEQLNRIFQEMAQQAPEVELEEVFSWVETAAPETDPPIDTVSEQPVFLFTTKTILMLSTLITAIGASIWMYFGNSGERILVPEAPPTPIQVYERPEEKAGEPARFVPTNSPLVTIPTKVPTEQAGAEWASGPIAEQIEGLSLPKRIGKEHPRLSFDYFSRVFSDSILESSLVEESGAREGVSDGTIDSFTEIRASSALDIVLRQGESCDVQIEAEDVSDKQYVKYQVRHGVLELSSRKGFRGNKLTVIIIVRDLERVDLSGAVELRTEGVLRLEDLDLRLSGASSISLNLNLDELELRSSGSSDIELRGTCKELDLRTSGASSVDAFDFEVRQCEVHSSGASNIDLFVEKELDIEADGASEIRYKGSPNIRSSRISGAASVKQKRQK